MAEEGLLAELLGEEAGVLLEELAEIGHIGKAEAIGHFLHHQRGAGEQALGLERELLVDALAGRFVHAFDHRLGERFGRDMEPLGILLHGMKLTIASGQLAAETDIETGRLIEVGKRLALPNLAGAAKKNAKGIGVELEHHLMHEVILMDRDLLIERIDHVGQGGKLIRVGDGEIRHGVVMHAVLGKEIDSSGFALQESGRSTDNDTIGGAPAAESMHLTGGDEEKRVGRDGIIGEINHMRAARLTEPDDLVEIVGMGDIDMCAFAGEEFGKRSDGDTGSHDVKIDCARGARKGGGTPWGGGRRCS